MRAFTCAHKLAFVHGRVCVLPAFACSRCFCSMRRAAAVLYVCSNRAPMMMAAGVLLAVAVHFVPQARTIVIAPVAFSRWCSSAGNLAFWMSLSSCLGRPACQQLLKRVSAAEASDKEEVGRLCAQYNERLVSQVIVIKPAG